MKVTTQKAGELVVRVVDADGDGLPPPKVLAVLCHGYGAPGTDLVGIAGEMHSAFPELAGVRFAFPEAPIALEGMPFEGRAWWNIDVGRFANAIATGTIDELMEEVPEGLPRARKLLMASLEVLKRQSPGAKLVVGGFSQGAMLTTDVALRLEEAPAGLAIFSGTLVARSQWVELGKKRAGLKVVQTHGTHDPLLPYAAAIALKQLLDGASMDVRFHSFRGGHGLDGDCIRLFAELLVELV